MIRPRWPSRLDRIFGGAHEPVQRPHRGQPAGGGRRNLETAVAGLSLKVISLPLRCREGAVAQPDDAASRRSLNLVAQGPSSVQQRSPLSLQEASNLRRKRSPSKSASGFLRELAAMLLSQSITTHRQPPISRPLSPPDQCMRRTEPTAWLQEPIGHADGADVWSAAL